METGLILLAIIVVGATLPVQAGVNASLGKLLGSPIQASIINFIGGLCMGVAFCLAMRTNVLSVHKLVQVPFYYLLGGILGCTMVIAAIIFAPKVGATTYVACFVVGNLISSVLIDHFGWIGFSVHPASGLRILGIVMLLSGLFLIQKF